MSVLISCTLVNSINSDPLEQLILVVITTNTQLLHGRTVPGIVLSAMTTVSWPSEDELLVRLCIMARMGLALTTPAAASEAGALGSSPPLLTSSTTDSLLSSRTCPSTRSTISVSESLLLLLLLLLDDLGDTPSPWILCMGLAMMGPSSELLFLAASISGGIGTF